MNYRSCCFVLMLFATIAWAEPSSTESVQLKPGRLPGTRYVTVWSRTLHTRKMNTEPTKITYAVQHRIAFAENTSKPDADGLTTVTMTPVHVQSRRVWPDKSERELDYDSKTTPTDSPLGKIFQPLLNSRYILTFSNTDELVGFVIRGNPWSKMGRASPESTRWIEAHEINYSGTEMMKQLLTLPTRFIPKRSVKQGATWIRFNRKFVDGTKNGGEATLHFTVSEVTDDQVVFTLATLKPVTGKDGKVRNMPVIPAGKIVFNRKTKTVTETNITCGQGMITTNRRKPGYRKETFSRYRLGRIVSDKPPTLPPLKPIVVPEEKPATKAPATKPADTPPAAPEKKAAAPTEK